MSRNESHLISSMISAEPNVRRDYAAVLAVGEPREWQDRGNLLPTGGNLAFVSFSELSRDLLEHHSPTVVYSPALGRSFDCIDLAVMLCSLGYSGSYRAMAGNLPRPEVIEREVQQLCPGLDFRIVDAT